MDDFFDFVPVETERVLKLKGVFVKDITDIIKLQEDQIQEALHADIYEN